MDWGKFAIGVGIAAGVIGGIVFISWKGKYGLRYIIAKIQNDKRVKVGIAPEKFTCRQLFYKPQINVNPDYRVNNSYKNLFKNLKISNLN